MSERIHVLAQQLLGKPSVEACDLHEIQALVQKFPYYAPAQFLLLEKLKQQNDSHYTKQLQKTVLYYHNPIAFEYFISSEKFYSENILDQQDEIIIADDDLELTETVHEEFQEETSESLNKDHLQTDFIEEDQDMEEHSESVIPSDLSIDADEINSIGSDVVQEQIQEESFTSDSGDEADTILYEVASNQVADFDQKDPAVPIPKFEKPESDNSDLVFEPYHTVDYFASQGIKLSQEELPKDKFGRQLKSFTEWLKTMKRLPANQPVCDASTEQKVVHLAEDSVHQAQVVTEAMAEVWIKQGNHQKALEIYQQLSLHNPSKKAYFAALIEKLKHF